MKFRVNLSSGSRAVPYGQTDGHDAANSSSFVILQELLKSVQIPLYVILDHAVAQ